MVRSFRAKGAEATSNFVWNYGHMTVPRHLRDIVVSEYGIADLRGRSDQEIITRLLNITDSRFQEELLHRAKSQGKIAKDYQIPEQFRHNLPRELKNKSSRSRRKGYSSRFPLAVILAKKNWCWVKRSSYCKPNCRKAGCRFRSHPGSGQKNAVDSGTSNAVSAKNATGTTAQFRRKKTPAGRCLCSCFSRIYLINLRTVRQQTCRPSPVFFPRERAQDDDKDEES